MKIRRSFACPYGSGRGMRRVNLSLCIRMQAAGWKQVFGVFQSPLQYHGGGRYYTLRVEWSRDLLEGSRFVRLSYFDNQGRYQFQRVLSMSDFLEEIRS